MALGTNAGLVYWYDRQTNHLSRLWCSDRRTAVVRLALVETVDLMLAVGNELGCVTIFQVIYSQKRELKKISFVYGNVI